jgi:hypothetical protein
VVLSSSGFKLMKHDETACLHHNDSSGATRVDCAQHVMLFAGSSKLQLWADIITQNDTILPL